MLNEVLQENAVNYYEQIKNELVDVAVHKKVREYIDNHYELARYYNVGRLIIEAQGGEERSKYGNSLIKDFSKRLSEEAGVKYDYTSLTRMRKFYLLIQKVAPVVQELTWSHIIELLPLKDINAISYARYYNVGRLIIEAQVGEEKAKYGDSLIKDYSRRLTKELGKGYSSTNLKYMRQFYILFQKGQALPDQLTWSHIVILLQLNDINFINYYIDITIKQNLGYRRLREKIKACEYERLDIETKTKLINKDNIVVGELIKNPIVINTNNNYEYISEKVLKQENLE